MIAPKQVAAAVQVYFAPAADKKPEKQSWDEGWRAMHEKKTDCKVHNISRE